ncbi:MAG: GWxTD domain-containing protein [Ignavibacteria bacterium]|jgi:GWxTD domain-containing protein|nr:GWxTD domain-containing protein [Ignavibacteria bacterium]MCU7504056.1 GWxTD domain-containing protein [Ignavibacteria bacterium]MCU7515428.1 GWxTD domain-containing protein [Ignavibacteria bacterium]
MKKILFFFIIALSFYCYAQPSRQGLNQMRGIFFDTIVIPSADKADCYITYQTTYNRLVFVKDKDVFTSRFSLTIEAVDSLTGKVYREIVDNEHSVANFEETNSESKYILGVIKLSLPMGSYKVLPVIYDFNTNSEHVLSQFDLRLNFQDTKWVLSPIVLKDDSPKEIAGKVLAGFDGNVPFSDEEFNMIIPVADTNVSVVYVELKNNDSLIYKDSLRNSVISSLSFSRDKGEIIASFLSHQGSPTRNFILPKFNQKLQEGTLQITVSRPGKEKAVFKRAVVWFNKPRSLNNLEYAVKILRNIEEGETESRKNDKTGEAMDYNGLWKYWKKFDPTPSTAYNELMAEFYSRVDYAISNFSLISNPNGADTDRGRVYIKFGKPKSVERIYQDARDVREVWVYDSPERRFVFVDKTGLGNFILSGKL